jgi:hypothetical protein
MNDWLYWLAPLLFVAVIIIVRLRRRRDLDL